jgi:hypothetical protein
MERPPTSEYVGFLAPSVAVDNSTSAARTRELLD